MRRLLIVALLVTACDAEKNAPEKNAPEKDESKASKKAPEEAAEPPSVPAGKMAIRPLDSSLWQHVTNGGIYAVEIRVGAGVDARVVYREPRSPTINKTMSGTLETEAAELKPGTTYVAFAHQQAGQTDCFGVVDAVCHLVEVGIADRMQGIPQWGATVRSSGPVAAGPAGFSGGPLTNQQHRVGPTGAWQILDAARTVLWRGAKPTKDTAAFKALTMTPSGPLEVVVDGKKVEAAAWVGRSWEFVLEIK